MPATAIVPAHGVIVVFSLPATTPFKVRAAFFRGLYGYDDKSQYGKYHYRREGLLDRLKYVPFGRGVFIIRTGALAEVKRHMRGRAKLVSRTVILTSTDRRRLEG